MTLHNRTVRQDVRELGERLGNVLEAQTSTEAFDIVETIRTGAIDYRDGELDSRDDLHRVLADLDPELSSVVARAFTTYFELVNLAEERERVRAIRAASNEDTLDDSLELAAEELATLDPTDRQQVLDDVLIEPTFTAHPTEARRKTVKAKLRDIAAAIETLDEQLTTAKERGQVERDVEAAVTSLWQTPQVRNRRPEPGDEARNIQWYLENTVYDVVGEVYDELEDALDDSCDEPPAVPKLFEFRSWAGSDRDGNPFVTPDVTSTTLDRQRDAAVDRHAAQLDRLSGVVSQDGDRIDVGHAVEDRLAVARTRLGPIASEIEDAHPDEPYRRLLGLMQERLDRVGDVRPGGYEEPAELAADLGAMAESLRANDAASVAEAHVDPVRRQVETFGFTLASLDCRDHQGRHTEAVAALLEREGIDYRDRDEAGRQELLTDAIQQDDPIVDLDTHYELSDTAAEVAELFACLPEWQAEYGTDAIDTYCISMTEEPSHVLEVLFLADQAGVVALPDHAGIDIVPLLETEYALEGAERIMGTLFDNPAYAQAVAARDDTQEVMLGYSDSSKENGYLAANWALHRNQRRLAAIADDHDVTLRLFHGRGGSISRGGGPMNNALLALPSETVTGEVKFTEQGEAIAEKYSNPRIAERNTEQMLNAQLRARANALTAPNAGPDDAWPDAMAGMADAAREEYRDLLETDGFVSYYERVTPITVIEDLNLGSRPASRSGERTVEDLRAIPWVFSWTQARCIITGWYGLGTGIATFLADEAPPDPAASRSDGDTNVGGLTDDAIDDAALDTLRTMYDEWSFFRTMVDNAAVALARTDMGIAGEYATLAPPELRERFFPRIEAEYTLSADCVRRVADRDTLLRREWLDESLERRNPYVDPLNLLQTHLLDRTHRTEEEERTLRLTVKGIAAGMKNTG